MGRIHFIDNPWPAGHGIKDAVWHLELRPQPWLHLHIDTDDYKAEGRPPDPEEHRTWESPGAWCNYGSCRISSTHWGHEGLPLGHTVPVDLSALTGHSLRAEEPLSIEPNDRAFHIYLLGHDAVGQHEITFGAHRSDGAYDLSWSGAIALVYSGQTEFQYRFRAAFTARFDGLFVPEMGPEVAQEDLEATIANPHLFRVDSTRPRGGTWFVPRTGALGAR